jgi:hypothetical protein
MPTIETDVARIQEWINGKQTNEQEMLRRLNFAFKQPLPYERVRKVVISALVQMKLEANDRPDYVRNAVIAESALAVWHKVPWSDPSNPVSRLGDLLVELATNPNRFDIDDLSEIIRIIGTWVENGGGGGGVPKSLTEAFRPGDTSKGLSWDAAKRLIWDKTTVRQREDRIRDVSLYHVIEAHVRRAWIPPKRGAPSGLMMFRVNRDDLCRKIDLLCGFLKGATISGTTTDTALVLETWGSKDLHPGYYLFPVATIAASLHHTLLEAALALSLIGAIDTYYVGYYSSLTPIGGFPNELEGVKNILDAAERDQRNRRLIAWYAGSEAPTGCILLTRQEADAHKQLFDGKALLDSVRGMSQYPSQREVAEFISHKAPAFYGSLPVSFKIAPYG